MLEDSLFFPMALSLLAWTAGAALHRRFRTALCSPLLVAVLLTMAVLWGLDVPYESYYRGAQPLHWLLTPATICLALPLWENAARLRKHWKAILAGIAAGMAAALTGIWAMSHACGLSYGAYATLLPKSITAAIGMDVSAGLGGDVSLTAAAIILTGILGNMFAELWSRLFHLRDPVARGVAIGSSAHAIGTAKAAEMGETEGAASSLAMVVTGLFTVAAVPFFAGLFIGG